MRYKTMMPGLKTIALLGMGILCAPSFGENTARPGTVNYIEGEVYLEGTPLNPHDVGSIDMDPGQVLVTGHGKAEILLTPGVYMRMGEKSAVKMISSDLMQTQLELERGRASVEVDEIYEENNLRIIDGGVVTQLVKPGYYEFIADHPTLLNFTGKAAVELSSGKYKVVKGHHEFDLTAPPAQKPAKFDERDAKDDLYNWSSLRSQYLAEDNNQIAGMYADASDFDPGWYWDPYALNYTFIGMNPFWSPFGFGFYPPWWGGYYGGGYYGRGYYGRGYGGGHINGGSQAGAGRGGFSGGGAHGFSGGGGLSGGGGGGFHGGGGGGGGHR
jgi:hypothetical protein